MEKVVKALVDALTLPSVLALLVVTEPLLLHTYASEMGGGAILTKCFGELDTVIV